MSFDLRRWQQLGGSQDHGEATGTPGKRTLTMALPAQPAVPVGALVQQRPAPAPDGGDRAARDTEMRQLMDAAVRPDLHTAASHGVSGSASALPHLDTIQRAFGRHDVSGVRAHSDDRARAAAHAMGAEAFATGDHVAFAGAASLHTAAHEAAHVVQQRAGVHLKGGVGAAGDVYERHADAVADRVVAGESAEALLDQMCGGAGGGGGGAVVQRKEVPVWGGTFEDKMYGVDDGVASKGAHILLEFKPRSELGNVGDAVSLVQTVQDTTRLTHNQVDYTPVATTSQVDRRKLGLVDGAQPNEVGVAIDQEVLSDPKDGPQHVVNLDPRYSEQRMAPQEPLKLQPDQRTGAPRSTVKTGEGWKVAALSDSPALNTDVQVPQQGKQTGTITGGMKFEVAALYNNSEFLGSVRWGWQMQGNAPVLDPAQITLCDQGNASPTLLMAAAKWNRTQIEDPTSHQLHQPMQLPTNVVARVQPQKSSEPRWMIEDVGGGYLRVGLRPEMKLAVKDITPEEHKLQMAFDEESDEKDGDLGGPYLGMVFEPGKKEKAEALFAKLLAL